MSGITVSSNGFDKYVVTKVGYSHTIVNLTEREARAINSFIEWACLEDDYIIEPIGEYVAEEWGT